MAPATLNPKIVALLLICIVAATFCIWQFANLRGYKSRGRRRSSPERTQRTSDVRTLSGPERKLFQEAKILLQAGKVQPAARILEQLNMPREAIQALEDAGLIHEAAKILLRMQRPNRAGVVYARHGMWEHAAQCFKVANMPLEVAKCAREAGNFAAAAANFVKVGRHEDAADCFERAGEPLKAARGYLQGGNRARAMALFDRLARGTRDVSSLDLLDGEVDAIVDYFASGDSDARLVGLADILSVRGRLGDAILALLSRGRSVQAAELLRRSPSDIGPVLMSEVNYEDGSAEALAKMFVAVDSPHYAGMIFERMNAFDRAGEAFEQAQDFERAAYCYERAGMDQKARALKERAKSEAAEPGARAKRKERAGFASFALADVPTEQGPSAPDAGNEDEDDDEAGDDEDEDGAENARPPAPVRGGGAFGEGNNESTAMINPDSPGAQGSTRPSAMPAPALSPRASIPAPELAAPPPSPVPALQPLRAPEGEGLFTLGGADDEDDGAAASDAPAKPQAAAPLLAPLGAYTADDDDAAAEPVSALAPAPGTGSDLDPSADAGERTAFHAAKFLADLDPAQKDKLWRIGETLSFAEGESILTYNDEPTGIYIIIQGAVSCFRQVSGRETYVDEMGESESFGELWLLADQPTAVRFVAARPAKMRVIHRDAFNDLMDKDGTIARKVYKRFTLRLLKRLLKPQNASKNQLAS